MKRTKVSKSVNETGRVFLVPLAKEFWVTSHCKVSQYNLPPTGRNTAAWKTNMEDRARCDPWGSVWGHGVRHSICEQLSPQGRKPFMATQTYPHNVPVDMEMQRAMRSIDKHQSEIHSACIRKYQCWAEGKQTGPLHLYV